MSMGPAPARTLRARAWFWIYCSIAEADILVAAMVEQLSSRQGGISRVVVKAASYAPPVTTTF